MGKIDWLSVFCICIFSFIFGRFVPYLVNVFFKVSCFSMTFILFYLIMSLGFGEAIINCLLLAFMNCSIADSGRGSRLTRPEPAKWMLSRRFVCFSGLGLLFALPIFGSVYLPGELKRAKPFSSFRSSLLCLGVDDIFPVTFCSNLSRPRAGPFLSSSRTLPVFWKVFLRMPKIFWVEFSVPGGAAGLLYV